MDDAGHDGAFIAFTTFTLPTIQSWYQQKEPPSTPTAGSENPTSSLNDNARQAKTQRRVLVESATGTKKAGRERKMAVPEESRPEGPRKKHWLSRTSTWIAAGAAMGLMADLFFLPMCLAAFQQGTTDVGIGYMILMVLFPPVTIFAGWRSGREEPPSSKDRDPGKRRWLPGSCR